MPSRPCGGFFISKYFSPPRKFTTKFAKDAELGYNTPHGLWKGLNQQ